MSKPAFFHVSRDVCNMYYILPGEDFEDFLSMGTELQREVAFRLSDGLREAMYHPFTTAEAAQEKADEMSAYVADTYLTEGESDEV